jgi:hypothetical protein
MKYERKREKERGAIASSWNLIYQILPNLFPEMHTHTHTRLVGWDRYNHRKETERERKREKKERFIHRHH